MEMSREESRHQADDAAQPKVEEEEEEEPDCYVCLDNWAFPLLAGLVCLPVLLLLAIGAGAGGGGAVPAGQPNCGGSNDCGCPEDCRGFGVMPKGCGTCPDFTTFFNDENAQDMKDVANPGKVGE